MDTFWDLGYFDNVAIWLAQSVGFEVDPQARLRDLGTRPLLPADGYRDGFFPALAGLAAFSAFSRGGHLSGNPESADANTLFPFLTGSIAIIPRLGVVQKQQDMAEMVPEKILEVHRPLFLES